MEKLNKAQIEYIILHVLHWSIYGIINAFASAFLLSKGFNNTTIGIVVATTSLLSVLIQPTLANYIDNSQKEIISKIIVIITIITIAIFTALFFITNYLTIAIFYCLLGTVFYSVQPLINSLAFKAESSGKHINFGIGRAGGSIGYALTMSLMGKLILSHNVNILMLVGGITCVVFIVMIIIFSKELDLKETKNRQKSETISYSEFLKNNPLFLLISLGVCLIFVSNSINSNYMLQIVRAIGGDSSDMGNILGLSAALEVIPMILSGYVMTKIDKRVILTISAWTFVVKMLLTALAPNTGFLYAVQIVQLCGFSIFLPTMVSFIHDVLSEKEAVRGQAMYTMAVTLSFVLASIFGGYMLDNFPVKVLLFSSAFISSFGAILITRYVRVLAVGDKK